MNLVLKSLKQAVGSYRGEGVNHEGQKFLGTFTLQEILGGVGFQILFDAVSAKNPSTKFHSEHSVVAPNVANGLSLFNLNTNTPFLAEHRYVEELTDGRMIFRFGDLSIQSSFREEIHLTLSDSTVRYEYYWGMPGGDFAYRSGATMTQM